MTPSLACFTCTRYVEAEKTNARWAMMAVAGILFTEALGFAPKWFNVGAESVGDYPLPGLIAVQAAIMGFIENKRQQGFKETGKVPPCLAPAVAIHISCCQLGARLASVCHCTNRLRPTCRADSWTPTPSTPLA